MPIIIEDEILPVPINPESLIMKNNQAIYLIKILNKFFFAFILMILISIPSALIADYTNIPLLGF